MAKEEKMNSTTEFGPDQLVEDELISRVFFEGGLPFQKTNSLDLIADRFVTARKILLELRGTTLPGGVKFDDLMSTHKCEFIAHPGGLTIYGNTPEFDGYINIGREQIARLDRNRSFRVDLYETHESLHPYLTVEPIAGNRLAQVIQSVGIHRAAANLESFGSMANIHSPAALHADAVNGRAIEAQRWNQLAAKTRHSVLQSCDVLVGMSVKLADLEWESLPEAIKPIVAQSMYLNLEDIDDAPLSYFVKLPDGKYLAATGESTDDLNLARRFQATGGQTFTAMRLSRVFAQHPKAKLVNDRAAIAEFLESPRYGQKVLLDSAASPFTENASTLSETEYFDMVDSVCMSGLDKGATALGISPDEVSVAYREGKSVWECLARIEKRWLDEVSVKINDSIDAGHDYLDNLHDVFERSRADSQTKHPTI